MTGGCVTMPPGVAAGWGGYAMPPGVAAGGFAMPPGMGVGSHIAAAAPGCGPQAAEGVEIEETVTATPPLFVARPDVQVRWFIRGKYLVGVAHFQGPGKPIRISARANLDDAKRMMTQLLAQVNRQNQAAAQVGWGFSSITKAVSSVARKVTGVVKSKIIKKITNTARKVMKSPWTKVAITAAAVVFPPVGIPAAAAFHSANLIIDKVEAGGALAAKAQSSYNKLRAVSRQATPAGAKARRSLAVMKVTSRWRQGLKQMRRPESIPVARGSGRVRGYVRTPYGKARLAGRRVGNRLIGSVYYPNGMRSQFKISLS